MPTSNVRRHRTAIAALASAAAVIAATVLLGACSADRASLGSLPPSIPEGTTTTAAATTTTAAPVVPVDRKLTPDELLGWIATPVGDPQVYAQASTTASKLDIGAKTAAGAPTTFAIVGDASPEAKTEAAGWYEVALPSRPNGSTGWVPIESVTVTKTPFRIFVDLEARTLRVDKDGTSVLSTDIAIGTTENPTPQNGTYVTELIANTNPTGSYGPYAFGLGLHSDTLSEFGTGDGQVGIHGTNQPQLIGQPVSHGCVRLRNSDVQDLVALALPLGVPVFIT